MKLLARRLLITVLAMAIPLGTWAHPGGLNAEGCHNNRKTGDYHCHGSPAPKGGQGTVKKSSSGICHGPSSQYYAQTKNFTAYPSIEKCLDSGGRLPR
jgi:hypothetical protein